MSAIPPIEPVIPGHSPRLVRRRTPEEEQGEQSPEHHEQFNGDEPGDPDEDDGGLPHVDIRV
jgi:hypothetical protein